MSVADELFEIVKFLEKFDIQEAATTSALSYEENFKWYVTF